MLDSMSRGALRTGATPPDVEVAAFNIASPSGACTVGCPLIKGGSEKKKSGRSFVIGSIMVLSSLELALCLCLVGPLVSGAGPVNGSGFSIC